MLTFVSAVRFVDWYSGGLDDTPEDNCMRLRNSGRSDIERGSVADV
ncbi:hypothetical protein [Burkholderia cepacia]|nr:hypothetical protein [Burkholderia cepacia]